MVFLFACPARTQTSQPAKLPLAQRINQVIDAPAIAGMPLEKALEQYAREYHLNFVVDWKALRMAGVTSQTPVTVPGGKLSIAKVLDLTTRAVPANRNAVAWRMMGDDILISTQMRILLAGGLGRLPIFAPSSSMTASPSDKKPTGQETAARDSRSAGPASEINFDNMPLSTVLDSFRDTAKVNVHVNWRSLEAAGITRDTAVTLKVRDVSIAKAMDLVFDGLNGGKDKFSCMYWVVDEGVVEIATGEALNNTSKTKVFDVGDLLMSVPNFDVPGVGTVSNSGGTGTNGNTTGGNSGGASGSSMGSSPGYSGSSGNTGNNNAAGNGNQRQQVADTLIAIIKDAIGQDMWQPTGKGDVKLLGNRLVISQTPLGFKLMEQAFRR
jgi:hypothetical protein